MPPKKYFEIGQTVYLMLCLTKKLHITGNIFVLYYYFCVLQGLVDINKKEVLQLLI